MWKASWGLSHVETHGNPTPSRINFDDLKKAFLLKNGTLSISRERNYIPLPQGFSQI
jgi:hypothetical protein